MYKKLGKSTEWQSRKFWFPLIQWAECVALHKFGDTVCSLEIIHIFSVPNSERKLCVELAQKAAAAKKKKKKEFVLEIN